MELDHIYITSKTSNYKPYAPSTNQIAPSTETSTIVSSHLPQQPPPFAAII